VVTGDGEAIGRRASPDSSGWARLADRRGQALVVVVAGLAAVLLGALVLGGLAKAIGLVGDQQRAADLAALAGARAMRESYSRLFEPLTIGTDRNPRHLTRAAYLALGRQAAEDTARRNGAEWVKVSFPDGDTFGPVRIAVAVGERVEVPTGGRPRPAEIDARAEAELAPPADPLIGFATGGGYSGPLAYRQGKPMRPDVAMAFDRMNAAATAAGIPLIVTSGFRSDAEQARLFAARPDPRWVAPPGKSLHRMGTELDLGPPAAYGWLAANARRFGFVKRYSWEPWHFGYIRNTASASTGLVKVRSADGRSAVPSFVPAQYAPMIAEAAQRWNVSAALIAAQLYAESNFNPNAVSPAGARGIAQFMPGTARAYGLSNPFDARAAINAQAHHMRDLLRQFGSIPLALAAYNAGPGAVSSCGCIPPYPETRGYVARILGLLGNAGDIAFDGNDLIVRLVK
jgi:hypothetical protein